MGKNIDIAALGELLIDFTEAGWRSCKFVDCGQSHGLSD